MSARLEVLAGEKSLLLARSALCRLRLRHATHELRASLSWRRASVAAASASVMPPIVFGLALSFIGVGRAARVLKIAARIVVLAKVAGFAMGLARELATRPAYAIEAGRPLRAPSADEQGERRG